jgi:hypothetical protein
MIVKLLRFGSPLLGIAIASAPSFSAQMPPYPASSRQIRNLAVDPGAMNWNGMWERTNNTPSGLGWDTRPPLRPEVTEKVRQGEALAAAGKPPFDPTAACLPQAMPRMMAMVHPMEIIQKVGEVIIFAEWNGQVRRIYTDGRKYSEEKDPTFNGYSTGRWEHGDLVTEVRGFREKVVFNANGIVFTDKMVIRERFHQVDPNTLKYTMTVEDPSVLTEPWVASKLFSRSPTIEIGEYICEENSRNPMSPDGSQGLILNKSLAP